MDTMVFSVQFDLRTPNGIEPGETLLPVASFEEACSDLYAAIPAAAADMQRAGVEPIDCSYLLASEDGRAMTEIDGALAIERRSPRRSAA